MWQQQVHLHQVSENNCLDSDGQQNLLKISLFDNENFSPGDQGSEVKCICPEYPKLILAG